MVRIRGKAARSQVFGGWASSTSACAARRRRNRTGFWHGGGQKLHWNYTGAAAFFVLFCVRNALLVCRSFLFYFYNTVIHTSGVSLVD